MRGEREGGRGERDGEGGMWSEGWGGSVEGRLVRLSATSLG